MKVVEVAMEMLEVKVKSVNVSFYDIGQLTDFVKQFGYLSGVSVLKLFVRRQKQGLETFWSCHSKLLINGFKGVGSRIFELWSFLPSSLLLANVS